jgi:hypothetical protein
MGIPESVQADFAAINKAAGEFIRRLTGNDLKKDITLAAEMAGLRMLRGGPADLKAIVSGTAIIGAVSDELATTMSRFVMGWSKMNGIIPEGAKIVIPDDCKKYLPELTRYEDGLCAICDANGIKTELFPFVAATGALKLVAAGVKLKMIGAAEGLGMVMYHIVAGSKTVPWRVDN